MIEAFHVTKTYERGDRPALHDITLKVQKGEFVFLSGPSGAGKSTLLKLIFAAEQPTKGQILVNGRNIAKLRRSQIPYLRREIGVVFQDFKLISTRTVAENVAYTLRVIGLPESEVRRRVSRILKEVGLVHKQNVLPPKLSGGEQQRVAIARALVNDPAILLADEPTGNLDQDLTEEVMKLLENANARGTTVMVATHDVTLMTRYRKRVVYLQQGAVLDSPPEHWGSLARMAEGNP
ncbi:MAG: cell division ATP-binding protein FtsE [Myxococcota bacterium]